MKILIGVFLIILIALQYQLWVHPDGLSKMLHLKHAVLAEESINKKLIDRNEKLTADVVGLKRGNESIEERARNELGMIKDGESYYQLIKNKELKK